MGVYEMTNDVFITEDGISAFHIADVICVTGGDVYLSADGADPIILLLNQNDIERVIEMMKEYHNG